MLPSGQLGIILQFAFATLLPVVASALLTLAFKNTRLSKMGFWQKQILCGLVFGMIAIFGNEFGIKTADATMNVRDAAPLVAGLYFGGPAGIIAGIIGGVERWFSVLWGGGMFTRVACSTATIAIGFYAALLDKFLFQDRRPSWPLALAIGMVAEVLHLLLVFLTNLNDASHAFLVVQACSVPMISCNGISVALSSAVMALMNGRKLMNVHSTREISQVIQIGMLGVVVVGFVITVGFMFALQQSTMTASATSTLKRSLDEVKADIRDASDANLLQRTWEISKEVPSVADAANMDLAAVAREHNVSDIYVVDNTARVVASNNPTYIGFDMHSGEQSSAFLDLLPAGRSIQYVQDYRPMSADGNEWRKFAGVRIQGGFIQGGYDSDQFLNDIVAQVRLAVANRHVGQDGLVIVMKEDGEFVGTRKDVSLFSAEKSPLAGDVRSNGTDTLFQTSLYGVDYFAYQQDVEGLRAIALLPVAEAVQARDLAVLVISFMEVLVFAALFAAIYILIRHVVVNSIWQVNGTLEEITSGDLEAKVNVRHSSEFSSLSDDINRTVAALREAIAAEGKRIERDLATAKAIQSSALPRTFPPFPDVEAFDIYASMNAAREVGGDFYDFYLIDDHTLGFLIADVSGKGIPASLYMMTAKTELANYMKRGIDLAEAVANANRNLCAGNDATMFVTAWCGTLDYNTGELTYVNAGHNPPLLRHDGEWTWLKEKNGPILGLFEQSKYTSSTITIEPTDELFLYTDGVNEAFDLDGEEFGNARLESFLQHNNAAHPRMLVDLLRAELRRWANGAEQSDDITMLCLEYGVPPEVTGLLTVRATTEGSEKVRRRMDLDLSKFRCPPQVRRQIELIVEELFVNVCEHGYDEQDEPGDVQVSYVYNANPSSIVVCIADWGRPFDPLKYEPSVPGDGNLLTGMGVKLALENMDDAAYLRDGDRNVIAFLKKW